MGLVSVSHKTAGAFLGPDVCNLCSAVLLRLCSEPCAGSQLLQGGCCGQPSTAQPSVVWGGEIQRQDQHSR